MFTTLIAQPDRTCRGAIDLAELHKKSPDPKIANEFRARERWVKNESLCLIIRAPKLSSSLAGCEDALGVDLRKFEPYGAAAFEGHPKPHTHNKQPHYGVVGCGVPPPVVQIGPAKAVGLGRKEAKPDPKLSRRLRRRPSLLGYLLHRLVVDAFTYITHAGTNYISRRKYRLTHHRQQQEARKEATLLATCLVSPAVSSAWWPRERARIPVSALLCFLEEWNRKTKIDSSLINNCTASGGFCERSIVQLYRSVKINSCLVEQLKSCSVVQLNIYSVVQLNNCSLVH